MRSAAVNVRSISFLSGLPIYRSLALHFVYSLRDLLFVWWQNAAIDPHLLVVRVIAAELAHSAAVRSL